MGLLGPDIFISYRKSEAAQYARFLRNALEALGYRCFLDEDWQPPGYDIKTYLAVARRSRMFVLIGSKTVLDSTHVALELDAYDRGHTGWISRHWRRIFPISVDKALSVFESAESGASFRGTLWESLLGLVSEPETASAINEGRPSEDIPKRIARTYGLVSGTRQLLSGLAVVLILVLLSALVAVRRVNNATVELNQVSQQKASAFRERDQAAKQAQEQQLLAKQATDRAQKQQLLADQAAERARQQRLLADAYSRVDRARRLPEHDQSGNPNTDRMLSAIESWRVAPNMAAFQLMSQSLTKVALPVKHWSTGLGYILSVAIDPEARRIAANDTRMVRIFDRNGVPVAPAVQREAIAMAFANAGKELIVVAGSSDRSGGPAKPTEIIRLNAENGSEIGRSPLGHKRTATISSDGEWVAASDNQSVEVTPTRDRRPPKPFTGSEPCFSNDTLFSYQLVMLEKVNAGGRFVYRNVQTPSWSWEQNTDVDSDPGLNFIQILACGWGWIAYRSITSSPVTAYWSFDPKLSKEFTGNPERVVFGAFDTEVVAGISTTNSSHLFKLGKGLGRLEMLNDFSRSTAIALTSNHQFVTGDPDGTLTMWDYSDPRMLPALPSRTAKGLVSENNWATIPYRDRYLNSRLGTATPLISGDKRWKVEVDRNSGVAIVDVASGDDVALLQDPTASTRGAFSADSKTFAMSGSSGVHLWSLDPEFYLRALCRALPGVFDPNWNAPRFQRACQAPQGDDVAANAARGKESAGQPETKR